MSFSEADKRVASVVHALSKTEAEGRMTVENALSVREMVAYALLLHESPDVDLEVDVQPLPWRECHPNARKYWLAAADELLPYLRAAGLVIVQAHVEIGPPCSPPARRRPMPADIDPFGEDAVEAVARAVAENVGDGLVHWDRLDEWARNLARSDARAALAAARPFFERWQPIETAPKDGTEILAFVDGLFMGQMVLLWQGGYWREKTEGRRLKGAPTHWMPLPAPPSTEER